MDQKKITNAANATAPAMQNHALTSSPP